ncbi:Uncharacterised protein g10610 [Pycnogonum litorale]
MVVVQERRPMKYPYTMSAKIMQFPFRALYRNHWLYRWMIPGTVATFGLVYYIQCLVNSPANVARWEETQRRQNAQH